MVVPRLGDRVGEAGGLRGIAVGGRGQAEMLRFSLDLDGRTLVERKSCVAGLGSPGRGTNDAKASGVVGTPKDGGRRCLPIFMVSTFETVGFRINC